MSNHGVLAWIGIFLFAVVVHILKKNVLTFKLSCTMEQGFCKDLSLLITFKFN